MTTRTASDLFAHFAPTMERIHAAVKAAGMSQTCKGSGWRTPYEDARDAVAFGADDLSFGDDFDQVVAAVAARLEPIEAEAQRLAAEYGQAR